MISIYDTTDQGRKTRSQLLNHIQPGKEYTREDLIKISGLTYDQVRRQTKNLCIEGIIKSRLEGGNESTYFAQSLYIGSVFLRLCPRLLGQYS